MKKIEVLNLPQAFEQLKEAKGVNFAYALMKNRRIIDSEKEDLTKSITNEPDYLAFISKIKAVITEYCDVAEGEIIVPESVKLKDGKDRKSFILSIEELKDAHAESIINRKKMIKEYNDFLREDADITFYKISEQHIPEYLGFGELLMLAELLSFDETNEKMNIKVTNYQILVYINLFRELLKSDSIHSLTGSARNKLLRNFLAFREKHNILSQNPVIKDWNSYEEVRKNLAESLAATDIFGEVLIQKSEAEGQDQYVIYDQEVFTQKLQELSEEYKEQIEAFYNLLNETLILEVEELKLEELPEDFALEDLDKLSIFFASEEKVKPEVTTKKSQGKIRKLKPTTDKK